ncbi:MAG: hypothetical protein ABIP89_23625, partial [Polyangiaceae bacterium]
EPTLQRCNDIPDGGCPINPGACGDPACDAIYACNPGNTWSLEETCPPHAPVDAALPVHDAAPPSDASYDDVPGANGGPGCSDLEPPDCPLALAAACPNGCCGCEDLYVCSNGGWNAWGTCGPTGIVASH